MKASVIVSVWLVAASLLIVTGSIVFAGFIQLNDGTVFETVGTREDGDKVCGFVDGQIQTYPKAEVAHWNDAGTEKPTPTTATATDKREPSTVRHSLIPWRK